MIETSHVNNRLRPRVPLSRNALLAALICLIAFALSVPFLRAVGSLGDEGVLLNGAERLLNGERIYVDFFEFLPPGSFLITGAWLGTFGISMLSARLLAVLTIVGIAGFAVLVFRHNHAFAK